MESFRKIDDRTCEFKIDRTIYNDRIIAKILYWLSELYTIFQKSDDNLIIIKVESKHTNITNEDSGKLKNKINQDLIDYKTRDIVNQETKSIREILLIKAFSNNDDFEDYNLLSDIE